MKKLIDEITLQNRISEMACEIDSYYLSQDFYRNTQEPVIIIGVLTGSIFFMADLVRKLSIKTKLDFIRTSVYPGKSTKPKKPKIIWTPNTPLNDANILIVDDILDTGITFKLAKEQLNIDYPSHIKTATLLRKKGKSNSNINCDFVGFDIEDKFVVGYGLDYDGKYRELPYVAIWG